MLSTLLTTIDTVSPPLQTGVFDAPLAAELFVLGRLLFGGVLAFNGLNHFLDVDAMTEYAASKGVPHPRVAVVVTGGMLLVGGLGIALGIVPTFSAGALAAFLLVATPLMHDFWAMPAQQQEQELIHFLKNATMLGVTLMLLALSSITWPYAL